MGISRSASTVMAYLMEYEGMTLRKAWEHTRDRRMIIRPNPGFLRLLGKLEVHLKGGTPSLTAEEIDQWEKENGKLLDIGGTFDAYKKADADPAPIAAENGSKAPGLTPSSSSSWFSFGNLFGAFCS